MEELLQERAVMEPEMEHHLRRSSRKQLVLLVQELALRHPDLQAEMAAILEVGVTRGKDEINNQTEEDVENDDDWAEEEELVAFHSDAQQALPSLDLDAYRKRLEGYVTRVKQKKALQVVREDLKAFLQEAEVRTNYHEYENALDLYALVLDERLAERDAALTPIFDKAIDEVLPALQALLNEASSNIRMNSATSFTPLFTTEMRQSWLKRLFALWLKQLDTHSVEEEVPEMMLEIAWADDIVLLRGLVHEALQKVRQGGQSNIVDFKRQYRTRGLERFLKELPLT